MLCGYWIFCGAAQPETGSSCVPPPSWVSSNAARWLSAANECLWFGVLCGGNDNFVVNDEADYRLDTRPRSDFPADGNVRAVYIGEYERWRLQSFVELANFAIDRSHVAKRANTGGPGVVIYPSDFGST